MIQFQNTLWTILLLTQKDLHQKTLSNCTMSSSYCASNKVKIPFLMPVTAFKITKCLVTEIN